MSVNSNFNLKRNSIKYYLYYLIKKIDFFGKTFTFEEDGDQTYKTFIGGILTIVLMITITVMGFIFGQEIYLKKLPNVSRTQEILSYSRINISELPFLFSFDVARQEISDYTKYFTIESVYNSRPVSDNDSDDHYDSHDSTGNNTNTNFDDDNDGDGVIGETKIAHNLQPCLLSYFTHLSESQYSLIEEEFNNDDYIFCFPPEIYYDLYFQNELNMQNSTVIITKFTKCFNSTQNNNHCAGDLDNIISKFDVKLTYLNSYINPKNFTEPIVYYVESMYLHFSDGFSKKLYLKFTRDLFISDNGWILENYKKINYIALRSQINDLDKDDEGELYQIILESPFIRTQYDRNYIKIQEVFAKIGGLFSGLNLFAYIVLYNYTKFKYMMSVFNAISKTKVNCGEENVYKRDINKCGSGFDMNNCCVDNINNSGREGKHVFNNKDVIKNDKCCVSKFKANKDNSFNNENNVIYVSGVNVKVPQNDKLNYHCSVNNVNLNRSNFNPTVYDLKAPQNSMLNMCRNNEYKGNVKDNFKSYSYNHTNISNIPNLPHNKFISNISDNKDYYQSKSDNISRSNINLINEELKILEKNIKQSANYKYNSNNSKKSNNNRSENFDNSCMLNLKENYSFISNSNTSNVNNNNNNNINKDILKPNSHIVNYSKNSNNPNNSIINNISNINSINNNFQRYIEKESVINTLKADYYLNIENKKEVVGLQSFNKRIKNSNDYDEYNFYYSLVKNLKGVKTKSYLYYIISIGCCCKKYDALRTYYNFIYNKTVDKVSFYKYIEVTNVE